MVESITRIRFSWDAEITKCRAVAHDYADSVIGEVSIELPPETRRRIRTIHGASMHFRVEEMAERHLRAMLELRY
jgi:hypothetical protein